MSRSTSARQQAGGLRPTTATPSGCSESTWVRNVLVHGHLDRARTCVVIVCTMDHAVIINDTRTTPPAAMPSTPARLTMSRSPAKVIRASCADVLGTVYTARQELPA